ncbi:MAG: DNA polymerase I [Deltaproteobacteria bacterium]|nr:DNA polymerase I [Deltaproteobacteria bacterium]
MKQNILDTLNTTEDNVFYIVDVSSFIFRAYYSTGYLSTSDGTPTGAVFGVANMMVSLVKDFDPSYVAIAMDSKVPTFRKEFYPEYKANRPPPPDDLRVQFPFVEELVSSFGFTVLGLDGFEADDIIATAVTEAALEGKKCVILSSDKDLMQLINDDIIMYDTMKKKIWDSEAVMAKWDVPPSLVGDMLALSGDSSDNIPGVAGIGPKTAAALLKEFGSLENLLNNVGSVKAKGARTKLENNIDNARLSKKLVSLKLDVPLNFDLNEAASSIPVFDVLGSVLDKFELYRLKDRLFPDAAGKGANSVPAVEPVYSTVTSVAELENIINVIEEKGLFAIDLETTSVDAVTAKIVGVALSHEEYRGYYIPVAHANGNFLDLHTVLQSIKPILENENIGIIIQNVKYEDTIFRRHGIYMNNIFMDPMLASYLLRAGDRSHGLDALAKDILKRDVISYNDVTKKSRGSQLLFSEVSVGDATEYAAEDAEIAFCLGIKMKELIEKEKMENLLYEIEIPLARDLCSMELMGISLDTDLLEKMSKEFEIDIAHLEEAAYELAGRKFNLASPKQLQEIFFEELNLPTQKKTKTGFSTDSEVLEILSNIHELPKIILEHRNLSKLKNTYLDALPRLVNKETGRIHTSFNQAVAATGRLSSSGPNLQNIPIKTERGRNIRKAFTAKDGHLLLSADYSQIELRVLAHLSNDEALKDAYINGVDIHDKTARAVFGKSEETAVTKEERSIAKTVNFGVIYGKTAFSLAKELNISRFEAQSFIDAYFNTYKGVAIYLDKVVEEARKSGAVYTLLGRKREMVELKSRNANILKHGERMAKNMPVQGTAADLLKVAMINLFKEIKASDYNAEILLTVHDELVLEVQENEVEGVTKLVKETMENAMELNVPLLVEVGTGKNWGEAH